MALDDFNLVAVDEDNDRDEVEYFPNRTGDFILEESIDRKWLTEG